MYIKLDFVERNVFFCVMRVLAFIGIAMQWCYSYGQLTDSFSDGNLSLNPVWTYNTSDFEAIGGRLHNTNTNGGNIQYGISAKRNYPNPTLASIDIDLGINPSSANYIEYFISADTLVENAKNGYFIRIGDTKDNLTLYKLNQGKTTPLISGKAGLLNTTSSKLMIRLVRNGNGFVNLYYLNYKTNAWILEGTSPDTLNWNGAYCGIKIQQSGTTAIGKCYFDNVYLGNRTADNSVPKIDKILAFPNWLELYVNKAIAKADTANFNIPGVGKPASIYLDSLNRTHIIIFFTKVFIKQKTYNLLCQDFEDFQANSAPFHSIAFKYRYIDTPIFGDLIVNEIMSNPSPSAGALPEEEYVELLNISNKYLSLNHCKISDRSAGYILPDSVIGPGEYTLLSKNTGAFSAMKISNWTGCDDFPSLNNDEDLISIINQFGDTISQINYSVNWHVETWKKKGGWSLERIDTAMWCLNEDNWKSSVSGGGSPGKINSIAGAIYPELNSIVNVYCPDNMHAVLNFKYPLNANSINNLLQFTILENAEHPMESRLSENKLYLTFSKPFASNIILHLNTTGLISCFGTALQDAQNPFGYGTKSIDSMSLSINELLFDPIETQSDFIEIVNISQNIVDLKNIRICSLDNLGKILTSISPIADGYNLLPGDYIAFTTQKKSTLAQYKTNNTNRVFETTALPSWSNESGFAAITNGDGKIIDKFNYNANMHTPILKNREGVSLEKINPNLSSAVQNNWNSASSVSDFATPGHTNSQFEKPSDQKSKISLESDWFSPDNDGDNDQLQIHYHFNEAGYFLTATLFAENGSSIGKIFNNLQLNQTGELFWNGDMEGQVIQAGNYILFAELFNNHGSRIQSKLTFSMLKK